jgi:hypothetical protein
MNRTAMNQPAMNLSRPLYDTPITAILKHILCFFIHRNCNNKFFFKYETNNKKENNDIKDQYENDLLQLFNNYYLPWH